MLTLTLPWEYVHLNALIMRLPVLLKLHWTDVIQCRMQSAVFVESITPCTPYSIRIPPVQVTREATNTLIKKQSLAYHKNLKNIRIW